MSTTSNPTIKIGLLYSFSFICLGIYGISTPWITPIQNLYTSSILLLLFIFTLIIIAIISYRDQPPKTTRYEKTLTMCLILTILCSPFGDYMIIPLLGSIIILFSHRNFWSKFFSKFNTLDYSWIVFSTYCLLDGIFFISPINKISSIEMSCAFFAYGLLFRIAKSAILPSQTLFQIKWIFCWTLIISVSFALFQLLLNQPIHIFNLCLYPNGNPGLASIFSSWTANTAGFLTISFALLWFILYQEFDGPRVNRNIVIISLCITFIGILTTETRMAILFFIGMICVFITIYPFKSLKKLRFVLLLLPIILVLISSLYSKKWNDTLSNPLSQRTISDRIHQYQYAWQLFYKENSFFGVGLLNFRHWYEQYGNPLIQQLDPSHPRIEFVHNIYLSILTETGVIGFSLFCSVIVILIWYLWTALPRPAAFFGLYFLGGVLCINLADSWLFVLRFSLLLFIILGRILDECTSS